MIAWEDAPHLMPPNIPTEELDALEKSILPHQRQARRTGRPALGAGAVYQVEEDSILIDPVPIPDWWQRAYGFDVGWNRTAAIWGARDPDSGIYYLTHEYYESEQQPIVHAHSIKMIGEPWMVGAIDPSAEGSNQKDGTKLKDEYEDLGLTLEKANNAVNSGILRVLTLMQGGQFKVFRTLPNWLKEFRLYRRDEKGKIIKSNDHLMDGTRYMVNTDIVWNAPPVDHSATAMKTGDW
jgi:hypothetical protein